VAAWLVAPASAEGPSGEPVGFVSGLRYLAPALTLAMALLPVALRLSPATSRLAAEVPGRVGTDRRLANRPSRAETTVRRAEKGWRALAVAVAGAVLVVGGFFLQRSYLGDRHAEPDFATAGLNRAFREASLTSPRDRVDPIAVT